MNITATTLLGLEALREFEPGDLELLLGATTERRFAPGATLLEEGAFGASCFVLVEGEVEVTRRVADGERVIGVRRAGALLGAMALVDRAPRSATMRAQTPVVALELSRDVFEGLLDACSPLALRFQERVAVLGIRQLRHATARLMEALTAQDVPSQVDEIRDVRSATREGVSPAAMTER